MNLKKRIRLAAFFFLFPAVLAFSHENDQSVAFERVCDSISSHKITKGDFRQIKLIKRIKREMASSGIFIISAGDGILWQTQKPYFSSMAMTESAIIQTNADGKKSVMSADGNATFEQFAKVLSSVFNGNPRGLAENFDVEFIGTADNWNINLIPKNSSVRGVISEIEMVGHVSIELMTIHEPNGDYIRYEFLNHVYPDSLTDSEKALFES